MVDFWLILMFVIEVAVAVAKVQVEAVVILAELVEKWMMEMLKRWSQSC